MMVEISKELEAQIAKAIEKRVRRIDFSPYEERLEPSYSGDPDYEGLARFVEDTWIGGWTDELFEMVGKMAAETVAEMLARA